MASNVAVFGDAISTISVALQKEYQLKETFIVRIWITSKAAISSCWKAAVQNYPFLKKTPVAESFFELDYKRTVHSIHFMLKWLHEEYLLGYLPKVLQNNFTEITLSHECSPVNLLHISRLLFLKRSPLDGCFCS